MPKALLWLIVIITGAATLVSALRLLENLSAQAKLATIIGNALGVLLFGAISWRIILRLRTG
jgi:hypothetical protein